MTDHMDFAEQVAIAQCQGPEPTFRSLSEFTGVPVADLEHYALVKFVSARQRGHPGLWRESPRELIEARHAERWDRVAGIIDWIAEGR